MVAFFQPATKFMQSNEKKIQQQKLVENAPSLDARDVAKASNDEISPLKDISEDGDKRLEINIVSTTDQYQEVEIVYGNKKIRKRISKFLPENFANIIYQNRPSGKIGATNLDNLSCGKNLFLQEKFLRILAKINQVSEIKTSEKIWDSEERISTDEKAILLAVVNRLRPENDKIDRIIISQRSYEISNQNSFKNFISDVLELTKNSGKLANFLFGNAFEKMGDEKKSYLKGCLRNIISEIDEKNRDHQMKFLEKILGESLNSKVTLLRN